jgi:putative transposase
VSVRLLCRVTGMTRQNYYKQRSVRERLSVDEELVLELIRRERSRQPRLGGRKLMHLLAGDLREAQVVIGRDRFFTLLRRHDLLIPRRKRIARTTDSRHGFAVYANLAQALTLTRPHQLLVSDITYIRTLEGFMYLCLVMDAFSRAIVGFDCSDSLEMEGALRALSMALKQLPRGAGPRAWAGTMHHSDRGAQYCCGAYIERLCAAGLTISMTEQNHCYENSQAERLNGIMKQEYGLGVTFLDKKLVRAAVPEAVMLYNHHRPHQALKYQCPMHVHVPAMPAA